MSTLKVNTIQNTSAAHSSTPEEIAQGRAKAWVNFNGSGTVAIQDNFNVSSITDHAQGDFSIVFDNAFSDADYTFTVGHDGTVNTGHSPHMHTYWTARSAPTTTAIRMRCYHPMDSAKKSDGTRLCVAIF